MSSTASSTSSRSGGRSTVQRPVSSRSGCSNANPSTSTSDEKDTPAIRHKDDTQHNDSRKPPMSLRAKTLAILGLTVFGLVAAIT